MNVYISLQMNPRKGCSALITNTFMQLLPQNEYTHYTTLRNRIVKTGRNKIPINIDDLISAAPR